MKQHINKLVILVIISFFLVQFGTGSTEAEEMVDLLTLASVLEGEEIAIDEWSVHAREQLKVPGDARARVRELQERFSGWEWDFSETDRSWEASAVSPKGSAFEESVKIVSTPTKQHAQAYIIYEVNGHGWEDSTEVFLKNDLPSTFSNIFRDNPTTFSCIKSELDGKMESSLSNRIDGLLQAYKADEIESLSEESFISVTASSPLFAESLTRNHQDINLQLALRTQGLGTKTTLVIGTPIITIEY